MSSPLRRAGVVAACGAAVLLGIRGPSRRGRRHPAAAQARHGERPRGGGQRQEGDRTGHSCATSPSQQLFDSLRGCAATRRRQTRGHRPRRGRARAARPSPGSPGHARPRSSAASRGTTSATPCSRRASRSSRPTRGCAAAPSRARRSSGRTVEPLGRALYDTSGNQYTPPALGVQRPRTACRPRSTPTNEHPVRTVPQRPEVLLRHARPAAGTTRSSRPTSTRHRRLHGRRDTLIAASTVP